MTKAVVIHIPRGAVPSLPHDLDFSRNLYNAILEAENSGLDASVKIGDKYKAVVELV